MDQEVRKPFTIEVLWDEKTQGVQVNFKTEEYRNFSFVASILQMAADTIKFQAEAMMAHARQQAMAEQRNAMMLRSKLNLG